jgi:2'-hydroxyisoflavone reductase
LIGDRRSDIRSLRGRSWDAVIDTSAFATADLDLCCRILPGHVSLYVFVSTVAVYRPNAPPGPVTELSPLQREPAAGSNAYGPRKLECEELLAEHFEDLLVIRPGQIVGPHDPTDRFTYWPRRMGEGGRAVAPAPPSRILQILDVRDLANWMVAMIERGVRGTFNACGARRTMEEVVTICRLAASGSTEMVWVDEAFLIDHEVRPMTHIPLWIPSPLDRLISEVSADRAYTEGLQQRPLIATARDTLAWDRSRPRPLFRGLVGGRYLIDPIDPVHERSILDLWRDV